MSLASGTRLGSYEVTALIGAGGMGEVYRARDTKLNRDVALKVLPDAFALDADRLARFKREAQVLASLNHPNIGAIYGFEEFASGGPSDPPIYALVIELVDGPTLADVIARRAGPSGPAGLPLDETLPIARQIAEALQAAHEQGIIHRDLKPANIKVRDDETVKVLDFGLAKLTETGAAGVTVAGGAALSQSPTITSPALMTSAGMILGTAAYMSPEQAKGRPVDKRTDVWAFGCVLYEMLTGRRAFAEEELQETLANILKSDPEWTALPADVPPPVVTLLRACLDKERRSRIADVAAVIFVLDHATRLGPGVIAPPAPTTVVVRQSAWRRAWPVAIALIVGATLAGAGVWALVRPDPPGVVRMTLDTSGSNALVPTFSDRDVAITPDGSRVIYRGEGQLLVRALDRLAPVALTGLGAPRGPFVSPDGQWIGFFDNTVLLKRVAITGGPAVTITRVDGGGPRGATWGPDETIIYATIAPTTGLLRVAAAGGDATVLTKPDRERGEADHLWPEFLPGGKAVLYTITPIAGGVENAEIALLDLQTGTSRVLIRGGSHAQYVATGHLVYAASDSLRAVGFDLDRREVIGTPVPVLEGIVTTASGGANVAFSADGSLVYVAGAANQVDAETIVVVDRHGRESPLPGIPVDSYRDLDVSPDGTRMAVGTVAGDIWTYDFGRAALSRLTTHPAPDTRPTWTPDGQRIIFRSDREGYPELFWRPADGSGGDERLMTRADNLIDLRVDGWTADGTRLLFTEVAATGAFVQCAIGSVPPDRTSDVRVLVKNEFCNQRATVSPDGRSMAYSSNLSGRSEIYVERYPQLGNRQQISTDGGTHPLWSRNGGELFFRGADGRRMFVAPVRSGATLVAERPQRLFEYVIPAAEGTRPFDVTPDDRFVIIRQVTADGEQPAASLTLVLNWHEELKRLVPPR